MKKINLLLLIIVAGFFTSCATTTPKELVSARDAYIHANGSIAADIAPAELHVAKTALDKAEQSFKNDPDSFEVRDLAYIAQRKCEIAEATASIILEQKKQELAKTNFLKIQSFVVAKTKKDLEIARTALVASEFNSRVTQRDLSQSEDALAASELDGNIAKANLSQTEIALAKSQYDSDITKKNLSQSEIALAKSQQDGNIAKANLSKSEIALAKSQHGAKMTQQQLEEEKAARIAAEKRASDAQKALSKLAAVKNEPRGVVITLSGSVLFASSKAVLLDGAKRKLDQVLDVLFTTKERHLIVEGHTDSQGSNNFNMDLSQSRADAVRSYLIEKGYEGDLITAKGLGESQPVGNNSSPEGRANNRRVEIVIEKELVTSN